MASLFPPAASRLFGGGSRPSGPGVALLPLLLLLTLAVGLLATAAFESRWDIPEDTYRLAGDVYIGSLIYLRGRSFHTRCAAAVTNVYGIQMHMAEVYAVERINADPDLLGNITLGYLAREECFIGFVSVNHVLDYIGAATAATQGSGSQPPLVTAVNYSSSSPPPPPPLWVAGSQRESSPPVVGIAGPLGTQSSMAVAGLLTLYQTPQISQTATNDLLSDKDIYPYFFRVVPPDSFQTRIMVDLLARLNWTYASVVHDDDLFGYSAVKNIRSLSRQRGICIADSYPVDDSLDDDDFYQLAGTLVKNARFGSHVVIVFTSPKRASTLLKAMSRRNRKDDHDHGGDDDDGSTKMIFLVSADASGISTFDGVYDMSVGSLTVSWNQQSDAQLADYLRHVRPADYPANHFLRQTWDDLQGCANLINTTNTPDNDCYSRPLGELDRYFPVSDTVQSVLGIYAFATAIDDLVRERCPEALEDPTLAPPCVQPELVAEYLKKARIPSPKGLVSFNENGEIIGDFGINQLQKRGGEFRMVPVGIWEQENEQLSFNERTQWSLVEGEKDVVPESVCAKECGPGESYIQGELPCCWECHRCRNNEYLTENGTRCRVCPYLTWPDQTTFTSCERIPEAYLSFSDIYGVGLLALAGGGVVGTVAILAEVVRKRRKRVIKGAVLDMLLFILAGVLLAFACVPLYVLPASDTLCLVARLSFSASCTLIFGPVFVKTQLIYHVFAAAERFKRSTKMASSTVKTTLTFTVFVAQVAILVVSVLLWPVRSVYSMPVLTERYVELHCDQQLEGLLLPLSYNILLVFLCSVFGFLTRKLPDNFNESWYIFITVSTTLFVWVAFLPTYFTAFFAYHKAALLAFSLVLNGLVVLICLFAPKIYALHYVDDKDIKISDFSDASFSSSVKTKASEVA